MKPKSGSSMMPPPFPTFFDSSSRSMFFIQQAEQICRWYLFSMTSHFPVHPGNSKVQGCSHLQTGVGSFFVKVVVIILLPSLSTL